MITFTKALIGVGALGVTGLSAWGVYYASTPKTIQDKLSREGLQILNLNKENTVADEAAWKKKITDHKGINDSANQTNLKIDGLDLSTDANQDAENIKKFKDKCRELLLVSLGAENVDLKEKQAKKWCVKENS